MRLTVIELGQFIPKEGSGEGILLEVVTKDNA